MDATVGPLLLPVNITDPVHAIESHSSEGHLAAAALLCFAQLMDWKIWTTLVLSILVVLNIKVLPFIYHLRILNGLRFVLRSQRPKQEVKPEQLFHALITSSKACLMEIDVFGHKSNSTYFTDIDIARVHLITTMFGTGIAQIRGSTTMNGLSGKPASKFTVALGGVSCTFRRELRPYETYDMWTRILAWDEKWMYLVTHFVSRRRDIKPARMSLYPQQSVRLEAQKSEDELVGKCESDAASGPGSNAQATISASALSKIVFKNGRITIAPQTLLKASDLLPPAEDPQLCAAIEAERLRGLKLAALLEGQKALEHEFSSDVALGRHYDGFGIEGVVATLAQLGKVSPFQLVG